MNPEEEKAKLQWGGVKVTKGDQTVLNQLKVLANIIAGASKEPKVPQIKAWINRSPALAAGLLIGIAAVAAFIFSLVGPGQSRTCIGSAFGYPPTCSDDDQDAERTESNRGGDGTCKTTVVNGRNLGKCYQVDGNNECLSC